MLMNSCVNFCLLFSFNQGKGSFAYAWALDESSEERERGITMTVAVAYFDTKKYHVVVLDSPGHKDFIPNMISGATQADAAVLVIDASLGAFEAGMDGGKGQTREHAQLIRSFGVDHVIVAVNKMDAVSYSKDRFDFIRHQLGMFLRSCGFKDSSLSWIPLSAMENQNLVASPSDAHFKNWYVTDYSRCDFNFPWWALDYNLLKMLLNCWLLPKTKAFVEFFNHAFVYEVLKYIMI